MTVELCRLSELRERHLNRDLHVHTDRTDGRNSLGEMIAAATARGLAEIAITDHVRRSSDWFGEHARAVRAARPKNGMRIRIGLECKALDDQGSLDATDEMIAESELVLGSVHRFPDGHGGYLDWAALRTEDMVEIELQLSLGLIRNGGIHVLAHPGGMCQRNRGGFPDFAYDELISEAKSNDVAVELSSSYIKDLRSFVKLCSEHDPLVSVASDAHGIEELGRCRDLLRELGVG